MTLNYEDWLKVLPFALLRYHTLVHISTGAIPPPSLIIQHGGRASRAGQSHADRSSAKVQA